MTGSKGVAMGKQTQSKQCKDWQWARQISVVTQGLLKTTSALLWEKAFRLEFH